MKGRRGRGGDGARNGMELKRESERGTLGYYIYNEVQLEIIYAWIILFASRIVSYIRKVIFFVFIIAMLCDVFMKDFRF